MNLLPGTTRLTTPGAVLANPGNVVRIFCVNLKSGATAGNVILYNGTSSSGDEWIKLEGVVSSTTMVEFKHGLRFDKGCYVDVDSNSTYALITWTKEF